MRAMRVLSLMAMALALTATARAQDTATPAGSRLPAVVVDTVIVLTDNIFTAEQTEQSFGYRAANAIHVTTRSWVIRRTILLERGDTLDAALLEESGRNLRTLGIFRSVRIDTVRVDGRLAVRVRTADAWSTNPVFSLAGSGSTLAFTIGLAERNLLGTGSYGKVAFFQEPDRTGVQLVGNIPRIGRTRLAAYGQYRNLSDGEIGDWNVGVPYRAFADPWGLGYSGESGNQRILQFRQPEGAPLDTTSYRRTVLRNRVAASIALDNSITKYLRIGVAAEARQESYVASTVADPSVVPDSSFGIAGAFVRYRRAKFGGGQYWQGFGQDEDLDVSGTVEVTAWAAPAFAGYQRNGIGPQINLRAGTLMKDGFAVGYVDATSLITAAGIDSGQVRFRGSIGFKPAPRMATFLHVQAGYQKNPPPGQEFDLGLIYGPRTFGAHAFVGTRMAWGTLEHRWYRWSGLLGFLGVGVAGFVDYGGAWYPDQSPRLGGNVGLGLRLGSSISPRAGSARIDVAYRFGDGLEGQKPFGIAFGTGFDFFTGGLASGF
jgi:hypothetical protein